MVKKRGDRVRRIVMGIVFVVVALIIILLIVPRSGENGVEAECEVDGDCVPASCCHSSSCVPASESPNCSGLFCTSVCEPGTLDCGQGECSCIKGKCGAVIE